MHLIELLISQMVSMSNCEIKICCISYTNLLHLGCKNVGPERITLEKVEFPMKTFDRKLPMKLTVVVMYDTPETRAVR